MSPMELVRPGIQDWPTISAIQILKEKVGQIDTLISGEIEDREWMATFKLRREALLYAIEVLDADMKERLDPNSKMPPF